MKPSGWPPGSATELVGVPGSPRRTLRGALALLHHQQFFRPFLEPLDGAGVAVHAQPMTVEVADGHLARPQTTARAIGEAQQHVDVVVDHAARNQRRHVGGDFLRPARR